MLDADSHLPIYAADPASPKHASARRFFGALSDARDEFVLCELILIELYMQLRNPAIFVAPYTAQESTAYCQALKRNPNWRCVDYDPLVSQKIWSWAAQTKAGFRQIIDARIVLTLRHCRVTHFATAHVKHFKDFGFAHVWNSMLE